VETRHHSKALVPKRLIKWCSKIGNS